MLQLPWLKYAAYTSKYSTPVLILINYTYLEYNTFVESSNYKWKENSSKKLNVK